MGTIFKQVEIEVADENGRVGMLQVTTDHVFWRARDQRKRLRVALADFEAWILKEGTEVQQ